MFPPLERFTVTCISEEQSATLKVRDTEYILGKEDIDYYSRTFGELAAFSLSASSRMPLAMMRSFFITRTIGNWAASIFQPYYKTHDGSRELTRDLATYAALALLHPANAAVTYLLPGYLAAHRKEMVAWSWTLQSDPSVSMLFQVQESESNWAIKYNVMFTNSMTPVGGINALVGLVEAILTARTVPVVPALEG
jgi:hypothetical protein